MYNIFTLFLLVAILWQGEDIPHPIPDNIITIFILVGLDQDLQMPIYINSIKPDISCIICAYLLFIKILFKGVLLRFDSMDRISPVLELLFLHVPGEIQPFYLLNRVRNLFFIYVCYLLGIAITLMRATHCCIQGSRVLAHRISVQRPQWEYGAGLNLFR